MSTEIHRRDALRAGLGALSSFAWMQGPRPSGVVSFRLLEPAGLRRVAEPISTTLPVAGPGLRFRLSHDGRTIPAQFRPMDSNQTCPAYRLDFAADLGPGATDRYEVHYGPAVDPSPDPRERWTLQTTSDDYRITRDQVEIFTVDRSLRTLELPGGFPTARGFGRLASAPSILLRNGDRKRLGQGANLITSTVVREGPFVLGLRFAWAESPKLTSILDLEFPATRDQVVARWTAPRPRRSGGRPRVRTRSRTGPGPASRCPRSRTNTSLGQRGGCAIAGSSRSSRARTKRTNRTTYALGTAGA